MANERVFDEVEALSINGETVGGATSIAVSEGYVDQIEADDGGQGPVQYDEAGQQVDLSVTSTDILKLIALLISTPATAIFYGHESGVATYCKATIGTANSKVVCHTGRLTMSRTAYAVMTVDGAVRFNATESFKDVVLYIEGQSAPTLTYPGRLWKPTGVTHGSLAVAHPIDLSVSLTPRLLSGYGDTDLGLTAVDVAGWTVGVDLNVHDSAKKVDPDTWQVTTELLRQGVKDLVITLEGVGQTANKTLTLRNCKFRSKRKTTGRDYTGHAVSGVLQWQDPLTPWTVRTLDAATAADRLIDFA